MAEARISVDQDEFMCSVCLDLLKDPVAIPCGHSYCKICITGFWDQEDQMRVYSCPQCRQTFSPRPALAKNTILAEMVEKLKKIKLPVDCYTGAGDVQCDVCTGRKHKAVKSCLVCLNSYCQNHLEQHESLFKGKRHNLTEPTGRLQEMICPKHDKILEVFCRTDQKCICVLCTMDEHKNHDTVSTAAQRTEKQRGERCHGVRRWICQRGFLSLHLPDLSPSLVSEAHPAASYAQGEGSSLQHSSSVNLGEDDLQPLSPEYEELVEVLTRAVSKLNIEWPAEKQGALPKSKLNKRFLSSNKSPPPRGLP
ncbi:E3 ubiquitin/ISG15 ligase TRIM25 [Anabarilius grahami]|uniref:E3 ubiquitin/ISG15 ligase TRIM25 n=1 Tax=Anabarilius grahami TaxID=495550 RepID=A0A3N0Y1C6_ANAGA|nr:E3 ubiquitin/ISG15 ligase TRIM25 [Anabarilius grahami]